LYTVASVIKFLIPIVFGVCYILGLGWLLIGPLLNGSLTSKKSDVPLLQKFPLIFVSGLIINYGLTLGFQSLQFSMIAGSILSLFGIGCFVLFVIRSYNMKAITPTMNRSIGIAAVCLLFFVQILAEPLSDWDARSIWFFHAKMIYVAGSIGLSAGWQYPEVRFSHVDYPKLIPALSAQIAYLAGFWNEYIPKISLLFLLIPAVTWLFTFARKTFSFAILVLLIPFSFSGWLWNGYMDGYFGLYFSIAVLLLGRFITYSNTIDIISSYFCFIFLSYVKNEGTLALLIGTFLILGIFLWRKKYSIPISFWGLNVFFATLIVLVPFFQWNFYKQHWNLQNDLALGNYDSVVRIIERFFNGSYKLIFDGAYQNVEASLLLLGFLYCASIVWNKSFAKESIPALTAAGIYFLGMIIVYLATPHDLVWHLSTSVNRTMLSVSGCIYIASYYLLVEIENSELSGRYINL
jgi:hypothetical protein